MHQQIGSTEQKIKKANKRSTWVRGDGGSSDVERHGTCVRTYGMQKQLADHQLRKEITSPTATLFMRGVAVFHLSNGQDDRQHEYKERYPRETESSNQNVKTIYGERRRGTMVVVGIMALVVDIVERG